MRDYGPVQKFEKFDQLANAMRTTYKTSYKDACKIMMCSRNWVGKYIRPFVPCVYLINNKGNSSAMSQALRLTGTEESVWFDSRKFEEYVLNSVTRCCKRSKKVHASLLIPEDLQEMYYEKRAIFDIRIIMISEKPVLSIEDSKEIKKIEREKNKLRESMYYPEIRDIIHNSCVKSYRRTEAEWVDVPLPGEAIMHNWQAVHDRKDYGDNDETIYREFFSRGMIKIETAFVDVDGVIPDKGKVYYVYDPDEGKKSATAKRMLERANKNRRGDEGSLLESRGIWSAINRDNILIKETAWQEIKRILD